jgi:hypothetical protein
MKALKFPFLKADELENSRRNKKTNQISLGVYG